METTHLERVWARGEKGKAPKPWQVEWSQQPRRQVGRRGQAGLTEEGARRAMGLMQPGTQPP